MTDEQTARLETVARLRGQGRWSDAAAELAPVLVARPNDAALRFLEGLILKHLGRAGAAEAAFRRVLELRGDHDGAAALLRRIGESAEAAEQRAEAAALLSQDALREHGLQNYGNASRRARAAVALHPEEAGLHALLGECCRRLGQLDEARRHLAQALALEPHLTAAAELRAVLDDESPAAALSTEWRREGARLAREELAAWAVLDSVVLLVAVLPPLLVAAVPAAWSVAKRLEGAADLVLVAPPAAWTGGLLYAWAAGLWLFFTGGALLCGRLLMMVRKTWTGEFDGGLASGGVALFRRRWWQAALLMVVLSGSQAALLAGLVTAPLTIFVATVTCLAPALVLLGGRDAFTACGESYRAVRGRWPEWCGLLARYGLPGGLLAGLSLLVPLGLIVRGALAGGPALAGAVAAALVSHTVLVVAAWYLAHLGAMILAVAYRDTFAEQGLTAAAKTGDARPISGG